MGIWTRMEAWAQDRPPVRVAVVGAGYVGRGIVHSLEGSSGMRPALVVNGTVEHALAAFELSGHDRTDVVVSDDLTRLKQALASDVPAVTTRPDLVPLLDVDVVVEATGAIDYGARVMLDSMAAGKDVISMNAEVDATIGFLLHEAARENGVVYTIADGDQPGVLLRQIEFVKGLGFAVVAAVNCKRNLDVHQTPDAGRGFAARDSTSLLMTTAFGDGTKMNIENAVVANLTGLVPEVRGMHGVRTSLASAAEDITVALSGDGVVEYTLGGDFAAGVGVVGRSRDPEVLEPYMRYFKMGEGPTHFFFRPYHLVHLEVPVTVAEVVLDRIPLARPVGPPVAEVVAVAKRDLRPGEQLDGIGGSCCYGQIDKLSEAEEMLPVGLSEHARVVRPISRDHPIALSDVELDESAEIVRLRQRQDDLVGAGRVATAAS